MTLTQKHCIPCESGDPPLPNEKEDELFQQTPGWLLLRDPSTSFGSAQDKGSGQVHVHKLRRQFKFGNFKEAIAFVNKVADVAEAEGHHPDIYIFYNKVQIDLFTHAVGGLSENDFIMAAKINGIK